jgi:outer membrane protein assembly factor BamD
MIRISLLLALMAGVMGCGGAVNMASLDSRELFDLGMEKYEKGKQLDAIEAFQTVIFNFPGESLVDSAQYYLGLTYYDRRDYVLAKVEFNRLLINYPGSAFAPHAQLMRAVCFYKGTPTHYGLDQTDLLTAVRQFEDFLIDYPDSDASDEARTYLLESRSRLGRKLYENGIVYKRVADFRAARIYFQQVIDDYTDTRYAADATFELADTYFKAHDWTEAHERLENFRTVYPDHEQVQEATLLSCEAAFSMGEAAYRILDFALARSSFERYQIVCGKDSDKSDKIAEYFQNMDDHPSSVVDTVDAGS